MRFKDKVVLVTGSSANIGRAMALRFAGEGARLVINSKSNVEGGREVVEEIKKSGGEAIYIQADVSEPEDVKRLFREALDAFGSMDILINNAGQSKATPFFESGKEDWLEVFNNNFFSTVLCSQEGARIMKQKGGGKIINTASVRGLGHTGREGIIAYSAAKAAVINFTKTLAKELAPDITVNAVAPGFVYTSAMKRISQELKDSFVQSTLIKRWIDVRELADSFLFLAASDALTGTVLVVDGGFTLK